MFKKIINNYIKDLRSGKKIGEQEMIELLAQTVSYLSNDEETVINQSKGYVVYSYNQAAAKIAKGNMPEDEQQFIDKRLDLAISAVMDYLKHHEILANKNRMLFANRLTASIHMLTKIALLPNENKNEGLLNELTNSLSLWLKTFVDYDDLNQSYLKAAETEDLCFYNPYL